MFNSYKLGQDGRKVSNNGNDKKRKSNETEDGAELDAVEKKRRVEEEVDKMEVDKMEVDKTGGNILNARRVWAAVDDPDAYRALFEEEGEVSRRDEAVWEDESYVETSSSENDEDEEELLELLVEEEEFDTRLQDEDEQPFPHLRELAVEAEAEFQKQFKQREQAETGRREARDGFWQAQIQTWKQKYEEHQQALEREQQRETQVQQELRQQFQLWQQQQGQQQNQQPQQQLLKQLSQQLSQHLQQHEYRQHHQQRKQRQEQKHKQQQQQQQPQTPIHPGFLQEIQALSQSPTHCYILANAIEDARTFVPALGGSQSAVPMQLHAALAAIPAVLKDGIEAGSDARAMLVDVIQPYTELNLYHVLPEVVWLQEELDEILAFGRLAEREPLADGTV